MDRESLAKMLCGTGQKTHNQHAEVPIGFSAWEEMPEQAKDLWRAQADFLQEYLVLVHTSGPFNKNDLEVALYGIVFELEQATKKHLGRIVLRHQAWGIIDEEWSKAKQAIVADDYDRAMKKIVSTAAMCLRTLLDWPLIREVEGDLRRLERLEGQNYVRGGLREYLEIVRDSAPTKEGD